MSNNKRVKEIITNFSNWFNSLDPEMQQRVSDRLEGVMFTLDLKVQREKENGKSSINQ